MPCNVTFNYLVPDLIDASWTRLFDSVAAPRFCVCQIRTRWSAKIDISGSGGWRGGGLLIRNVECSEDLELIRMCGSYMSPKPEAMVHLSICGVSENIQSNYTATHLFSKHIRKLQPLTWLRQKTIGTVIVGGINAVNPRGGSHDCPNYATACPSLVFRLPPCAVRGKAAPW